VGQEDCLPRCRLLIVAAPVSPESGGSPLSASPTPPREVRDPRSQTGVSTRRLRYLVGRTLEVAVLLAIDVAGLSAAIYSGLALREFLNQRPIDSTMLWSAEREWLPFVLLVTVLIFARNRLYRPRETRPGGAQIVAGLFVAVVVIAVFSITTDNERFTTYLIFPYTFVASAILIPFMRGLFTTLTDAAARLIGVERRVLVVGEASATRSVEAALRDAAPGAGLRTVAHIDDVDHLADAIAEHHPHDVVLARPPDDETMLIALEACRERRIRLRVVPTAAGLLAHHADYVPGLAVPLFDIVPPTIQGVDWFVKRAFDLLISASLLVLLSPILLISILMIRLTSPGPIFFRDQRVGLGEQTFAMLKLRSMTSNAEQEQAELEDRNEADGALFNDVHGCGQRAGAQQQRQVVGFAHVHGAGNLEAVAQFALNHRCGQHLALAFFKQQDGHALLDVFAADVAHDAPALGVHRQVHFGLLVLRVKAGLGIGQAVAGQDDLLLDNDRAAVAF